MMKDYRHFQRQRELQAQRANQDARDAVRHAAFDLSAQDLHHKHDRPHFAVVGEGSTQSQAAYRAGWVRIFGGPHG